MEPECNHECRCGKPAEPDRRGFFKKAATCVLGALSILGPLGAALAVVFDPLRRKVSKGAMEVQVTNLTYLPADGVPRKFSIVASRVDAWNKTPPKPIGAVYLRRETGKPIQALNVVCPHAGCFVDYAANSNRFVCPCHNSTFEADGAITTGHSVAPRGLDHLAVEVRNENEVWVKFQNYRAGTAEKIPA
jgi:menaquinol-cytochrome c reductase iron-sulfur subunit